MTPRGGQRPNAGRKATTERMESLTVRFPSSLLRDLRFVTRYQDVEISTFVRQAVDRRVRDDLNYINDPDAR